MLSAASETRAEGTAKTLGAAEPSNSELRAGSVGNGGFFWLFVFEAFETTRFRTYETAVVS